MIVRAPAKLNLFLQVLGRRPDGYHDIVSLMTPVSLFDELEIEPIPGPLIVMEGGPPGLPPERNLAWKAANALVPHVRTVPGVRIRLTKRIPAGGGLGGGSSDAAAVLQALNGLWDCRLSIEDLVPLAASLGADVPSFLHGGPGVVRGVGEDFSPAVLPVGFPEHLAIVQPPFELSTPDVYRGWDTLGRGDEPEDPAIADFLSDAGPFPLRNDLEPPAFEIRPELRELKSLLSDSGAEMALMSGSGSCFWAAWSSESARSKGLGPLTKRLKFYIVSAVRGVPGQWSSAAS